MEGANNNETRDKIGWIVSGYFLTQAAFILTYGQLLLIFDRRLVFLVAILLFEIGSTLCGAAPSVEILIFGRCVAGVGAAGKLLPLVGLGNAHMSQAYSFLSSRSLVKLLDWKIGQCCWELLEVYLESAVWLDRC